MQCFESDPMGQFVREHQMVPRLLFAPEGHVHGRQSVNDHTIPESVTVGDVGFVG